MKKVPGFGHKREMLSGIKRTLAMPRPLQPQSIAIIGSGIAAASLATELVSFPGELRLIWAQPEAADGASGNPQGAIYPLLQAQWTRASEFYTHAFHYARQFYQAHASDQVHWTGVELLERSEQDAIRQKKMIARQLYPETLLQEKPHSLLMPSAGWLNPYHVVKSLFHKVLEQRSKLGLPTFLHTNTKVENLQALTQGWRIQTAQHEYQADHVVLCTGYQEVTAPEVQQAGLPIRPVRGQITLLKPEQLSTLTHVICQKGYALPPQNGVLCIGATYDKESDRAVIKEADGLTNIAQLNAMLGTNFKAAHILTNRAAVRATTPDHLPLQGCIAPGLSVLMGLGSRGFTTAPWLAHTLACQISGGLIPAGQKILDATKASRFKQRHQAKAANKKA